MFFKRKAAYEVRLSLVGWERCIRARREIDHGRRRVTLGCRCLVGDTVVLKGEALVLAPSRKFD